MPKTAVALVFDTLCAERSEAGVWEEYSRMLPPISGTPYQTQEDKPYVHLDREDKANCRVGEIDDDT